MPGKRAARRKYNPGPYFVPEKVFRFIRIPRGIRNPYRNAEQEEISRVGGSFLAPRSLIPSLKPRLATIHQLYFNKDQSDFGLRVRRPKQV